MPPDELAQISFRGPRPRRRSAPLEAVSPGAKYKTRPLNGIWATAPYLHNGSVPNLDALLQPAANRPKSFSIGVRTYDPINVGYQTEVLGFPRFNVNNPDGTPITGNSNAGHEYGANLSGDQRRQLIEYSEDALIDRAWTAKEIGGYGVRKGTQTVTSSFRRRGSNVSLGGVDAEVSPGRCRLGAARGPPGRRSTIRATPTPWLSWKAPPSWLLRTAASETS